MKNPALCLLGMVASALMAAPIQVPTNAPIYRAIKRHEAQAQRETPPPPEIHRNIDVAQANRDAQELAELARSVQAGVAQSGKGVVAKDLGERLKKIQKLAKRLRSELSL